MRSFSRQLAAAQRVAGHRADDVPGARRLRPREELAIELLYDDEMTQPATCGVEQRPTTFRVRSLRHVVESVMEDRFVPQAASNTALELAQGEQEEDARRSDLLAPPTGRV